ncbi:molybdenum cofactor guanylyltransferase [Haloferax namakaokahaiae]|uniref:Probable molybdenum cofactor guanylyltransferase n=1 Tax=Haloferax namakaokahaiae TaxID=1748331 RepID=A0ABD5ZC77_9EURY
MEDASRRTLDSGRAGVILAGGRSRRFEGTDKATALIDGEPMIHRVASALDPVVDELVVNCRADQRASFAEALSAFEVRFAEDDCPGCGPVFGLRTALLGTTAEYVAVLPCDMPLVPSVFLDHLFGRVGGRPGLVPCHDGVRCPFPSVVHRRAGIVACTETIRAGSNRLTDVLSTLEAATLAEREVCAHAGVRAFHNVNTRDELRAVAARL